MGLVKPKKFLGQHFLKDLSIAKDIADTVDVCPDLPILEVGPGMGVLTQFIMQKNRAVKVVELDYESVTYRRPSTAATTAKSQSGATPSSRTTSKLPS